MGNTTAYKDLHDAMLAEMPEGASHDTEACPLCNGTGFESEASSIETNNGGAMTTTFSQEDLDNAVSKAVADATAPLQSKIAEFEASQEEDDVKAKIDGATAPLQETISELQAQLDAAVNESQTAKKALDETVAFLEDVNRQKTEEAAFAARLESRVAQVKEVANFPDEYIAASGERWSKLDDETFAALIEDWKQVAAKSSKTEQTVPTATAMTASADKTQVSDPGNMQSVRDIFGSLLAGFDPRTL